MTCNHLTYNQLSDLVRERRFAVKPLAILGIGTAVPAYRLDQQDATQRLEEALQLRPDIARWARRIFAQCGVNTRYTCDPDLLAPADQCPYVSIDPQQIPSTETRMALYRQSAVPLAADAARRALDDSRTSSKRITHLITVSCTGMFLPGLDAELAWLLDLAPDVQRLPLQFLGCAAGLTAIREAMRIVRGEPSARVLVVCVELCSIHMQPPIDRETLFSAAFFGDGASACVIGTDHDGYGHHFALHEACARLIPETAGQMRWTIGNSGYRLYLSPQIPRIIAERLPQSFRSFWENSAPPDAWAIHPGGRGILDAVASSLELDGAMTAASRAVLRDYGNMSSATILFVLNEWRNNRIRENHRPSSMAAVAFGPGLTVEWLRLAYHP
jgi:predicted naringenin-chalcone synthase